jgi:amino acid adenylation domain-containing protein
MAHDLPDSPVGVRTLVELLRQRAEQTPEQHAYRFLGDDVAGAGDLSYGVLDRRARALGALLQESALPGARALLLYPPGLDYIAAFFGCLYAGVVAVPAYPPDPARLARTLPRLRAMVLDARPALALTTTALLPFAEALAAQDAAFQGVRWLAADATTLDHAAGWRAPAPQSETLALLQYTSGSTAAPKGVMLTHGNLLHNSALIRQAFGHTPASRGVIWLPPYHDMGLIGGIIQPLYAGFPVTLMSPLDLLQRPLRWLQTISTERATTSGGPNFAYDLCVRKVTPEQRATLDLASWRVAFTGAEPVRAATLERFAAAFAPCGFRYEAFSPCYGLAEATLIVTGGQQADAPVVRAFAGAALDRGLAQRADADAPGARVLVSCGRATAAMSQPLMIVDPTTALPQPPGALGEIWVSGPSVAQGYWDQPDALAQTFGARTAGDLRGPYLRTGDLGFVWDGELFIAGRMKDLIIIRGRNHYPQDIELAAEQSHPALRPGCGAAFAVEVAGAERLALVHEVVRGFRAADSAGVIDAIRRAVAAQHELQVYAVVLIAAGSIPKTSSGKIQRYASRAAFLDDRLEVVARSLLDIALIELADERADSGSLSRADMLALAPAARRPALEAYLRAQTARALQVAPEQLDPHQPIIALGLDSLAAVDLQQVIAADLGVALPVVSLLGGLTIDALATDALAQLADAAPRAVPPLAPTAQADEYPLAPGQQAIWFLHELAPDSAAYIIARAVRVRSPLDVPALRQAIKQLLERHAALRTTFQAGPSGPTQRVGVAATFALPVRDATTWDAEQLSSALAAAAYRPFDLAHGPLLRVQLFTRPANEHILLLSIHHIVADLWSLALLAQELGALYQAAAGGPSPALAPLPISYADHARRQAALLAGPQGERLWDYWRSQLDGADAALELPTDGPRPPIQTYRGAAQVFELDATLTERLKLLARAEGATLHVMLLAAFLALLHRYSGQAQIVVGTPAAGREQADTRGLVGYFVNPLPLRVRLADDPPFTALLRQVRDTTLAALEHQGYPFAWLVERLQPARDASRSPLFQVMFVLQRAPLLDAAGLGALVLGQTGARMRLGGLLIETLALEQRAAQLDLTLLVAEEHGQLAGSLEYNVDLFDATTITRMAGHLRTLLAGMVAEPGRRVADLPLLTEAEQAQVHGVWNASAAAYPHEAAVHTLFEAQVARTPDAVALVYDNAYLTYAALNARANQLAHALIARGVGPDTLIALAAERSLAMLVGILGILKAGGAYVPLDPTYPAARLAFMLDDTQAPVLLLAVQEAGAAASVVGRRSSVAGHVVDLHADWPQLVGYAATNPPRRVRSDQRAYVIYTSGSTGQPKGVMVLQRGLLNLVYGLGRFFADPAVAAVGLITSISFDISVNQIFPALLFGRALHIIPEGVKLNSAALLRYAHAHGLHVLDAVPSYIQAVLRDLAPARLPNAFRSLLVGGEPLDPALVQQIFAQLGPQVRVVNIYGLSEISDVNAFAVLTADGRDPAMTIGAPLQNNQLYILNRRWQLQPIGVVGEVCISGASLSRGYLNRPDLTAARFVPNPFAGAPPPRASAEAPSARGTRHAAMGTRLCATGDLGRWRADGRIELLGRMDQQVKVRGFRIEVGEIEMLLAQQPGVRACAVLARTDGPGGLRLVAYVVAGKDEGRTTRDESEPSSFGLRPASFAQELRTFLAARLPEYMVPSAFVLLDALPTTPNGKLDRRALPAPDLSSAALETAYVAPRTPTEATVAGIWAELLGVAQVSRDANFFALGGHSLLATQLIARLGTTLGVELPLRALFEAPTLAALAERVTAQGAGAPTLAPIPPAPRDQPLPLSSAQQRLWLLDQLEPGSPAYVMPGALRCCGALDILALQHSLEQIVQRHEVLRTTFAPADGRPVALIAPFGRLPLPVLDLGGLPAHLREGAALRLAAREALRPFDLVRGALLRAVLLRLTADDHVVLLSMHHIIADGWSLGVLTHELSALYSDRVAGRPGTLPALPIQYADYAVWEHETLLGAGGAGPSPLQAQLDYWRTQLADLPTLELPLDRPRPPIADLRGARSDLALPAALAAELTALGQRAGVTLFMTLLAVFQIVLARYSGQDDIVVGTPVARRTRAEVEPLIGCFVNTLVLRGDLRGDPRFDELLGRVRAVCLDAYAHQELPFERLVETLTHERDLSRSPLFQVMFAIDDAPEQALVLPGLTLRRLELASSATKFDLTLTLVERAGTLCGSFEYRADLFDAATIRHMAAQFLMLLAAVVAQPAWRLSDLPPLTTEERALLAAWNMTASALPRDGCVHQLVATCAERTPDAIAIATLGGAQQLTYRELDVRANRLAAYLRGLGVGPEVFVGVCLDRSPELVVALLAVLKAGAAFLALDPAYPAERLAFMLGDAGARVLLTTTEDAGRRTQDAGRIRPVGARLASCVGQVVDLIADWPLIAQPTGLPDSSAAPDSLAYVIYTSGSTGRPKGVGVPHRGLLNLVLWHQRAYDIGPADRATHLAGLGFDASVWELWPYLAAGACVVLADEQTRVVPELLRDWLAGERLTISFLPTPLAEAALALGWPAGLALRAMLTGGDHLRRWPPPSLPFALVNHYGPTEYTVVASGAAVPTLAATGGLPAIGRPIANTQLYLLDRALRPVPLGAWGEICIGGAGLARGYLGRPDLTAEQFVPNPFATPDDERRRTNDESAARPVVERPASGERLYRTGDLARYRPDGQIQFLGRRDQQVQLRGFRVEPGEVAAALGRHPGVRACAVVARTDGPGGLRLVAYVVPAGDDRRPTNDERADPSFVLRPASVAQALRAFLAARLPASMLPSAFVLLDALPLTPNGKLDRAALPAPTYGPAAGEEWAAPQTPEQEIIAGIWAELLGVAQVGRDANFFALGGHSLLATQVIVRLRTALGVELPLRALFEAPTLAALAERVVTARCAGAPTLAPIRPAPRDRPLPLSSAQQRLWFLDRLMPGSPAYSIPIAVRISGPLDLPALGHGMRALIARHDVLRTVIVLVDGLPTQLVGGAAPLELPTVELRGLPLAEREAAAQRLLHAEARRPFDLTRGPLIRVALLRLTATEHVLLLNLHHIVADGWSMGILVRELATHYRSRVSSQSAALPELPALPIQYADYAVWERAWARDTSDAESSPFQAQLAYWRGQLAGAHGGPPALELPSDWPRAAVWSFRGARHSFALTPELSRQLRALSQRAGATLFMTLLAALQTLLHRYTRQSDLVVGTPIANRERAEVAELIGCFVNTLALRSDLAGDPRFDELLGAVRTVCLDAYAHQDVPLDLLIEALRPGRDLSHAPLFQVLFVLQNAPLPALELPGLTLTPTALATETAKFDLTLDLTERADGLSGAFEYSADLFDAATITRMQRAFLALLAAISAAPDQRLSQLALLAAAERSQLLAEWSTTTDYPTSLLHRSFEAQAARTPDAVALVFEAKDEGRRPKEASGPFVGRRSSVVVHVTYAELNARANQLARHLRRQGVGRETLVALYLAPAPALIVALLAALKAGAAYVPLDPAYPAERLAFILADAQVRVLIVAPQDDGRGTQDDWGGADIPIVHLAADQPGIAAERADNLDGAASADSLAYVIYTSGSTGRPKGALMSHANVARLFAATREWFRFGAGDVWTLFHSCAFDFSVWEVWGALLHGGRLVLVPFWMSRSPGAFVVALAHERVTVLNQTPSAFRQLLAADAGGGAWCDPALRLVIFGGEALDPQALAPWFARYGDERPQLVNMYGITETTVHVTYRRLFAADAQRAGRSVIGARIPDLALYVLDPLSLQPLPPGVPGEVFIGGAGLARGYLRRPDLTAERFVPNPFATNDERRRTDDEGAARPGVRGLSSGVRLYRTGDLARYRPDGDLLYLGRIDQQVKLRGYRIELGEIAATLRQHPRVREATVIDRVDGSGELGLVAYVVPAGDAGRRTHRRFRRSSVVRRPASLVVELRAFLAARLPTYMLPAAFVVLDALPLTPNGKLDRAALPAPEQARSLAEAHEPPRSALEQAVARIWQAVLAMERVGLDDNFFDLGGHSLRILQVQSLLRAELGYDVTVVELFRYPTIRTLAQFLRGTPEEPAERRDQDAAEAAAAPQRYGGDIAIIGMAGRFPGAGDVEAFWANLRDGVESISFFSDEVLAAAGVEPALFSRPDYVRARGVLAGAALFDAGLFGLSPREAETMDPQHRVFLEAAWEALERAGYDSETYAGRAGVYAGASPNSYLLFSLASHERRAALADLPALIGSQADALTMRVSYKLNLRGPSVTVQTACSTSLVAVCLACQSLLDDQCDMALAGGVSISVPQETGYRYQEGGISSPDGHCRAFDARAQGTVSGSGVGVVVLRRLADALADGDSVLAVIKGFAVNNDGADKVGYTAPSVAGQAAVIAVAQAQAGIDPATVGYVEAHGTATPLGDPIEIAALAQAFRAGGGRAGRCALGSVKSNIGHLDAAAGVAGLIKAVLALQHQQLPPSLHFTAPNPQIDFAQTPFYVNAALADWPAGAQPRRAGVSSFGIGGTNAHVVLEEPPAPLPSDQGQPWQLLLISARTPAALETATANLAAYLRQHPAAPMADLAYTLQVGRRALGARRALVCRDRDDALRALDAGDARVLTRVEASAERPVVFMFPGQGAQRIGMGDELYQSEARFRTVIDQCAELLMPHLGLDLRAVLYPQDAGSSTNAERRTTNGDADATDSSCVLRPASELLDQTQYAQPALFVVEYALAQLWMAWGVLPQALIGHSIGEYVAATLAGVLALDDALALVAARGRLLQQLPGGGMLAVALAEQELRPLLTAGLDLAAVNGPAACVVAGPDAALAGLEQQLTSAGVPCRRLRTSHAFHSAMVEPALDAFGAVLRDVTLRPPRIPYLSNLTGSWISAAQATDPAYWVAHLRQTVRFADGLRTLGQPEQILLEVGPGHALSALARQHPQRAAGQLVLTTLDRQGEHASERAALLGTLAQLWLAGARPSWGALHAGVRRQRLVLPTYPFERQRYWVEQERQPTEQSAAPEDAPRKRPDIADWFYLPSWKRSLAAHPAGPISDGPAWLLFIDDDGLGALLTQRLGQAGAAVVSVAAGERWGRLGERAYAIAPSRAADYDALLAELDGLNLRPGRIVHLWGVTSDDQASAPGFRAAAQARGFYSVLTLAQALGRRGAAEPLELRVLTNAMQAIAGEATLFPEKATVLGLCQAIPQEYAQIACQSVDLVRPALGWAEPVFVAQLLAELAAPISDPVIAYRGRDRWTQTFEPARLAQAQARPPVLRERGVYLITGGFGGIGMALARELGSAVQARLVLVGRTPLPERASWAGWLATHAEADPVGRKLRAVLALEASGAEVLTLSADVTDEAQMRAVVAQARQRFGAINGVIHAAGGAGGGVIQLKSPAVAAQVLAPRLQGSWALEQALADQRLDLLVLCSSLASVVGGFGQADYCAANAFLDAFARAYAPRSAACVVAINWDTWQAVGMAAAAAAAYPSRVRTQSDHPLLDQVIESSAERLVYRTMIGAATHWVLAEHRIMGRAVFPSTAYLELARAALVPLAGDRPLMLCDVALLAPLALGDAEQRELRTIIEVGERGWSFRIVSRAAAGEAGWLEHIRGAAAVAEGAAPPARSIDAILAMCQPITAARGDAAGAGLIAGGPRWHNLLRAYAGADTGLALLELDAEFASDLRAFKLHPALLDVATSFAAGLAGAGRAYLPLSYERLTIRQPLPARLYSHAHYRAADSASGETLTFDVALLDEGGAVLVEVNGFVLRRVDPAALRLDARPAASVAPASAAEALLGEGMLPDEGVEVFRRILMHPGLTQVVVSTRDLAARARQVRASAAPQATAIADQSPRPTHGRPELRAPYVAPRGAVEQRVAEIWQSILGIDQVGAHDDFFELGGDSLIAVQLAPRLRDALHVELPLATLFEAPTVAGLAARIAAASPVVPPPIQPLARHDRAGLPLSFAQQRLWLLDQLWPGSPAYNVPVATRITGRLDVAALRGSIDAIIRRHEVLRSSFGVHDGQPMLVVAPALRLALPLLDMSGLPERRRATAAWRRAVVAARRPFDLARGPLLRGVLLRLGAHNHLLVLVLHHSVFDGWSIGVLMHELAALYPALAHGQPVPLPPLPPLPIQYADYAAWQRDWLRGATLERQLTYWRAQLAGLPAADLPADTPNPARPTYAAAAHFFTLPRELTDALLALSRQTEATLFMALVAGLKLLLHGYSGQSDIAIGAGITNRSRVETEGLIGFFVNTLVLRTDLAGDPSFRELLGRVRAVCLGAYAHQDVPFEQLVAELQAGRNLEQTPFFRMIFAMQSALPPLKLEGLTLTPVELDSGVARFDLGLYVAETPQGLSCALKYRSDLFRAATIARLAELFAAALSAGVAQPDARLSTLVQALGVADARRGLAST